MGAGGTDPDSDRHVGGRHAFEELGHLAAADDRARGVDLEDQCLRVGGFGMLDRRHDLVGEDRVEQSAHLEYVDRWRRPVCLVLPAVVLRRSHRPEHGQCGRNKKKTTN